MDGVTKAIEIKAAKGDPANPVNWADMWSKFDGLVVPVLGAGTRGLFETVREFGRGATVADVTRIVGSIRPAPLQ